MVVIWQNVKREIEKNIYDILITMYPTATVGMPKNYTLYIVMW